MTGRTFLGLDLSTQGLKATILQNDLQVATELAINFERDLPHYETQGGVRLGENGAAMSPSAMFLEAMDVLFGRLGAANVEVGSIVGISASGQQHGSVYWREGSGAALETLEPSMTLLEQLGDKFSVPQSPIWMDASTAAYCRAIEEKVGGAEVVAELTGSKAFRRFTGPQIAKIKAQQPSAYAETERISLISAFVASLLVQKHAPEDVSDATGTNIFDLRSDPPKWSSKMICVVGDELEQNLCPAPVYSFAILGLIGSYFQQRYGFAPDCKIAASAGDNPCSAAGMLLRQDEDLCISLGTSDTAFMISSSATPCADVGSVYRSPIQALSYMPMVVYTNGAFTREAIRDYGGTTRSWEEFERLVQSQPAANNGVVGFHLRRPEIAPETNSELYKHFSEDESLMNESEVSIAMRCRGALEMRALAIRHHISLLGMTKPKRIVVTGGGAKSSSALEIFADVLQCPVYTSTAANSASLGAAYRAYHALECEKEETGFLPFVDAIAKKKDIESDLSLKSQPTSDAKAPYDKLYELYARVEPQVRGLP